jgi:hypothetical protein
MARIIDGRNSGLQVISSDVALVKKEEQLLIVLYVRLFLSMGLPILFACTRFCYTFYR